MKNKKKRKKTETKSSVEEKKIIRRFEVSKAYLTISVIVFIVLIIAGSVCYFLNVPRQYYVWIVLLGGFNCMASIMNWVFLIGKYATLTDLFGRK